MSLPLRPAVTRSPSSPPKGTAAWVDEEVPFPKAMTLSVSSSSAHTRSLP